MSSLPPMDARLAQAILRLSSDNNYTLVMEWLAKGLAACDEANRRTEGAQLHRSQGAAVVLDAILRAPENAQKALVRAKA